MTDTQTVRTRIAPSPTGDPHVGTAYIALFNLCFAKKHSGQFILRIEDTDQARSTKQSEDDILESLAWLNLTWDEGPDKGGPYGPYRQSERREIYQEHIKILLEKRWAYHCFCTKEDLQALRQQQVEQKQPPGYFGNASPCRELPKEAVQEKINAGVPYVIRLRVPIDNPTGLLGFYDHVRKATIIRQYREIDDQVLMKSDGLPTYHMANVVDDHLMDITHVIRGEEWINSTYKHILLYHAFAWKPPQYYHLGLLRNPDKNKSKISKRRNPVSLKWFRAAGYYAPALVNFLGLMGYSRYREGLSADQIRQIERFTLDELIQDFDPEKFSATGAAFDFGKLDTVNFDYVSRLSDDDFFTYLTQRQNSLRGYFDGFHHLFKERFIRAEKGPEYWSAFIFKTQLEYTKEDFASVCKENLREGITIANALKKNLKAHVDELTSVEAIKEHVIAMADELSLTSRTVHMFLRIAITGSTMSLPLYEAMYLLGIYRCLARLDDAKAFLNKISS